MTCMYIYRKTANRPVIFGTEVEQTITCNLTVEDYLDPPYTFHCWLVKEGYKATLMHQTLQQPEGANPWNFNSADVFKPGVRTITVDLILSEN